MKTSTISLTCSLSGKLCVSVKLTIATAKIYLSPWRRFWVKFLGPKVVDDVVRHDTLGNHYDDNDGAVDGDDDDDGGNDNNGSGD